MKETIASRGHQEAGRLRIASIGECMLELRAAPGTSAGHVLGWGGDTLNTALYMARLLPDATVSYVTALGDDPYSATMLEGWRAEGIDTGLVATVPRGLPGLYAIATDGSGERSFHYWRSAAAARRLMRTEIGLALEDRLAEMDLVYLSGISLSILSIADRKALLRVLRRLRRRGVAIAVDSNYRPRGWTDVPTAAWWFAALYRVGTIALPSFDDEVALVGDADPGATVERLRRLRLSEIVVKNGAGAVTLAAGKEPAEIERPDDAIGPVVDTTAAGDSFNAGYLAARLAGAPPEEAARTGHRLAGAVIGHPGAVIPRDAMPDLALDLGGYASGAR